MQVEVSKWGNSLALRIPTAMAKELGVASGSKAELTVRNGKLVLSPEKKISRKERYQRLLASLEHLPKEGEVPVGGELGNEALEW